MPHLEVGGLGHGADPVAREFGARVLSARRGPGPRRLLRARHGEPAQLRRIGIGAYRSVACADDEPPAASGIFDTTEADARRDAVIAGRAGGDERASPPTMRRMGDVLAGIHAAWEFESDSVLIRFERGIRTPKLLPGAPRAAYTARGAGGGDAGPGQAGDGRPARGAASGRRPADGGGAGQLKEGCDPYRLVLPAERETLAEYYADELRAACGAARPRPAERFLVDAPAAPLHFKAYDGKASFDGRRWPSAGSGRERRPRSGRRATRLPGRPS